MIRVKAIWGFVVAASPWGVAVGCSCIPGTLEQQYQGADNVLIAEITGCAPDALFGDGYCGNHGWSIKTVEDLKGSSAQVRRLPSDRGNVSSCDLAPKVGERYLLFLTEGRTNLCGGNMRLGEGRSGEVEVLRAYRDGTITKFPGPWDFHERYGACSLSHGLDGAVIEFSYIYTMSAARFLSPVLPLGVRRPSKPVPIMTLTLDQPFKFEGRTRIQVGNNGVPLKRSRGRGLGKVVFGDAVLVVLNQLSQHGEVVINGTRSSPRRAAEPFRLTTTAAQASSSIAGFKACIAAHPDLLRARD